MTIVVESVFICLENDPIAIVVESVFICLENDPIAIVGLPALYPITVAGEGSRSGMESSSSSSKGSGS